MALKDFKNQKGFIDLNNETSRTEVVQGIYNEVYPTNPIENLNRSIRKCTKNKGSFPTIKSLEKSIFLAIREASKKWNIKIQNWGTVLNQLHILFDF